MNGPRREASRFIRFRAGRETIDAAIVGGLAVAVVILMIGAIGGWVGDVFSGSGIDIGG